MFSHLISQNSGNERLKNLAGLLGSTSGPLTSRPRPVRFFSGPRTEWPRLGPKTGPNEASRRGHGPVAPAPLPIQGRQKRFRKNNGLIFQAPHGLTPDIRHAFSLSTISWTLLLRGEDELAGTRTKMSA